MDVKQGLCWKCEEQVPADKIFCNKCGMAVYCSNGCQSMDAARHRSVECRMWGPKECNACGSIGKMKECLGCHAAFYCNGDCQKKGWESHKSECNRWKQKAIDVAEARDKNIRDIAQEAKRKPLKLPYYFGNQTAYDLLGLPRDINSTSEQLVGNEMHQDLSLLLAGCGDLRNAIQTIKCVPAQYTRKLRFHLNDVDHRVMARNVLLLYMIATGTENSSIASIWLSTLLSQQCFEYIKNALTCLSGSDAENLKIATNNVVHADEETLTELKQIWQGWSSLDCSKGSKDFMSFRELRSKFIESMRREPSNPIDKYPLEVEKEEYRKSIEDWFKDGIFQSPNQKDATLQFLNPTLTGPVNGNGPFQYCLNPSSVPFKCWDVLEFENNKSSSSYSLTELLHRYLSDCVAITQDFVKNKRLVFEFSVYSFEELKNKLPENKWHFDRVFTSNLADYYGMRPILKLLEPLLNKKNGNATFFVCYMNWFHAVNGGMAGEKSETMIKAKLNFALEDLKMKSIDDVMELPHRYTEEYNYTIPHFINYLRGECLVFTKEFRNRKPNPAIKTNIPSWSQILNCNGLRMLDFRKERNRIVPFLSRINARRVTLKRGLERFLEWQRTREPQTDQ